MADTSARTLRLLSLLQSRQHWPGTELAGRLGISRRTLRRDVDRLRELGYPVRSWRGADGGYELAAGAALPPLVLDDDEAAALAVGLRTAARSGVAGLAEPSVRALAKIAPVMPTRLRRQAEALEAMTVAVSWTAPGPGVDSGVLTTIALACRDSERLRFGYTAADGARTGRYVEPHRLVSLSHLWYLVGYDLTRHDWRSYRLDRLADPVRTGQRFRPRELPAPDAAAFVRAGINDAKSGARAVWRVEAVIDAPAAAVRERIGRWATVTSLSPASCRVQMTTDSLDWPAFALGVAAAPFRVVSPPELLERLSDWASRFRQAGPAATGP